MRNKLIVSWLFDEIPGAQNNFFQNIDIVNLPYYEEPFKTLINENNKNNKDLKFTLQDIF